MMKSAALVCLVATVVGVSFAFDFSEPFPVVSPILTIDFHIDAFRAEVHPAFRGPAVARFARQVATSAAPSSEHNAHKESTTFQRKKTCCRTGVTDLFKMKDVINSCFDEVVNTANFTDDHDLLGMDFYTCSKANKMKMIHVCAAQCVATQLKMMDEDGKLLVENIKNYLKENLQLSIWLKRIADRTIDTCSRSLNNTLLTTPDTGDMKCRTSAVEFKHCMWLQFEMNCPEADRKTDGAYCTRLQTSLDKLRPSSLSAD